MLPFVKIKLNLDKFYIYTMHTLSPHIIFNCKTPLCADIMSYYKKKNPRGWIYQSNKQTASITVLRPQDTSYAQRVLSGRLQSMRARDAHSNVSRDAPKT